MTPLAIIYLVLLAILLLGGLWPRVSSERALLLAAAIVAVLFVFTMLRVGRSSRGIDRSGAPRNQR